MTGQATTVARRNLANAVATVSAQELKRAPAPSIDQALQGKVAGANIQSNSGRSGRRHAAQPARRLHHQRRVAPLYVIDGVIVSDVAIASGVNAVTASTAARTPRPPRTTRSTASPTSTPTTSSASRSSRAPRPPPSTARKASNGVVIITTKRGQRPVPTARRTSPSAWACTLSNTLGSRRMDAEEAVEAFPGLTSAQLDEYYAADGSPRQFRPREGSSPAGTTLSTETLASAVRLERGHALLRLGLWLKDDKAHREHRATRSSPSA